MAHGMEEDGDPWMQVPKFVRPGIRPFLKGEESDFTSFTCFPQHSLFYSFIYVFIPVLESWSYSAPPKGNCSYG